MRKIYCNFTYIDDFDFLYVFSDLNAPTRAPIYRERSELSAWDSVARTTCVTACVPRSPLAEPW
jgi:hypothetical protein